MATAHREARLHTPGGRRILAAAERCFGTLGFRKTSVADIAAEAQVSKPLVYRYFCSKEQLYEVAVERVVTAWNEEVTASLVADSEDAPSRTAAALRRMHRTSLDFAARSQLLQGLLARDARMVLAEYSDVVERSVTVWRDLAQSVVQRGVAAGEVRSDLPTSAIVDAVTELHLAYAERVVAGQDTESNQRNGEVAFECLLHGLCVPTSISTGENRDD
jgi:TetR/AcrR family transcriptional regulator